MTSFKQGSDIYIYKYQFISLWYDLVWGWVESFHTQGSPRHY